MRLGYYNVKCKKKWQYIIVFCDCILLNSMSHGNVYFSFSISFFLVFIISSCGICFTKPIRNKIHCIYL